MPQGITNAFVHYGIREQDMETIQQLCEQVGIDFDWFQTYVLEKYHTEKMHKVTAEAEAPNTPADQTPNEMLSDNAVRKILEKALEQISTEPTLNFD